MKNTTFESLGLDARLLRALNGLGFDTPTPIQAAAIPPMLEGRDLIGLAQTGSGKTAAFVLPMLQNLAEDGWKPGRAETSALILAPTRELAVQIHETIQALGRDLGLRSVVILGGVGRRPQEQALAPGAHIVVGTPGRILDLMSTNHLKLREVTDFVLDEADRMLDMGFIRDVRKIVAALPKDRQTAMFSATWPDGVAELAARLLDKPVTVEAGPRRKNPTPEAISQRVVFVGDGDDAPARAEALRRIFDDPAVTSAIVFTRTKRGANRVAEILDRAGVSAAPIHGNKSQNARQRALNDFKDGAVRALVATDIAARGVDVKGVSHVVNYDMPATPEDYVHRIGRTARAGASGAAVSLCGAEELDMLRAIERQIGSTAAARLEKSGQPPRASAAPRPAASNGKPSGRSKPASRAKPAPRREPAMASAGGGGRGGSGRWRGSRAR